MCFALGRDAMEDPQDPQLLRCERNVIWTRHRFSRLRFVLIDPYHIILHRICMKSYINLIYFHLLHFVRIYSVLYKLYF